MNLDDSLKSSVGRLAAVSDTPSLDAQLLLAHILEKNRSWVLAHPEITLSASQQANLLHSLARLETGEPLPYVLGHWEFYGLDFFINNNVLIPRPETELLVETAISWLEKNRTVKKQSSAVDVGTGSGCIAVAMADSIDDLHVLCTDISQAAIDVAQMNAERHHVADRLIFIQCDILPQDYAILVPPFDLITANLPYIPTKTLRKLNVHTHEPTIALDGGKDGLVYIHRLIRKAAQILAIEGLLLLEIEATLGQAVCSLGKRYFPGADIQVKKDLSGHDRLVIIRSSGL